MKKLLTTGILLIISFVTIYDYSSSLGKSFTNGYAEGYITADNSTMILSTSFNQVQSNYVRLGFLDLATGQEFYQYLEPGKTVYTIYVNMTVGHDYLVYVQGTGSGYLFCEQ
jgi:hypothetical protein